MAVFEASTTLAATPEIVFDYLARPANLQWLVPPEAGLVLVRYPERLAHGSKLEFQMTGYGPAQNCVHEIIEFDETRVFVERQVQGPLRKFVHEHAVEAAGPNQVTVTDRIEFAPPVGFLRFVVTEQRVLKSLRHAVDFRHRALRSVLAGPADAPPSAPESEA